jgi:hypothetical protein
MLRARPQVSRKPLGGSGGELPEALVRARHLALAAAGVVLGTVVFWAVLNSGIAVLKSVWPAYAAAAPEKAYSLPMLFVRLVLFGSAIASAAAAATIVSRLVRMGWIVGFIAFAASIPDHFYPGHVWEDYPAWYHYTYLLSILPWALSGSWLARRARSLAVQARAAA